MIVYHATSELNFKKTMDEGILFGKRNAPSRCTYFSINKTDCSKYGEIVLSVNITDLSNSNYHKECWQFRYYDPIDIINIIEIEERNV